RWDFISILLIAKRVKSLFKRAGDGKVLSRMELPLRRAGGACRTPNWLCRPKSSNCSLFARLTRLSILTHRQNKKSLL
ncbi:hypothetical protein, partial [uncultured Rikenella sp.]|uniref:hypothetical protein n=1 Tax=uncultured Rikenella sp. TaxID=368003 RepID=UPI0026358AD2